MDQNVVHPPTTMRNCFCLRKHKDLAKNPKAGFGYSLYKKIIEEVYHKMQIQFEDELVAVGLERNLYLTANAANAKVRKLFDTMLCEL